MREPMLQNHVPCRRRRLRPPSVTHPCEERDKTHGGVGGRSLRRPRTSSATQAHRLTKVQSSCKAAASFLPAPPLTGCSRKDRRPRLLAAARPLSPVAAGDQP